MHLKVCCIASVAEAELAIASGASAIGLVSAMPSGPGVIDESSIATIAASTPTGIETYLLTSRRDAPSIVQQYDRCRPTTLQLVDELDSPAEYERLRQALPHVTLVQVIHVLDDDSVADAVRLAPWVDRILLDSGNPRLAVKELGGTGRTHDWTLSARIRQSIDRPLLLAGGLHADNVAQAIAALAPFGVDVCSGVRVEGALDAARLHRFVDAVHRAT